MDWSYSLPVPASASNAFINAQEDARRRRANEKNNSARWAMSEHQVHTIGSGNLRVPTPVTFEVRFLQEPQFSSGCALVRHPDPVGWFDPSGDALVRSWLRDTSGCYIGVALSYRVQLDADTALVDATPPLVELLHFLTFTGLAYKAIDGVDLSDMTPHSIDF